MKKTLLLGILIFPFMMMAQQTAQTNDFYDDDATHVLSQTSVRVEGEISEPVTVNFDDLPMRSVVVKETLLENGSDKFIGAYRYDGYSLYDILNRIILKKKNEAEFPPIIDLYVEVENDKGEKVVLSWGEIYYPIHRHEILIATRVARIVPSKTRDLWPLPAEPKLVVASDLLTHRNISRPVVIRIKSYDGIYDIRKGMKPMYAPSLAIEAKNQDVVEFTTLPALTSYTFPAVFYGRGTGIHGTTPFEGIMMKDVLKEVHPLNAESIKKGIFSVAGRDGYHAVFTFSEIMNRNDQAEVLLITTPENEDGGKFKLFPAADFFSDRAIRSLNSVRFGLLK